MYVSASKQGVSTHDSLVALSTLLDRECKTIGKWETGEGGQKWVTTAFACLCDFVHMRLHMFTKSRFVFI